MGEEQKYRDRISCDLGLPSMLRVEVARIRGCLGLESGRRGSRVVMEGFMGGASARGMEQCLLSSYRCPKH